MAETTQERSAQQLISHFNDFPLSAPTPIHTFALASELVGHPDKQFCLELINSFATGFDIGYRGPDFMQLSSNLKSATDCPEAIFSCIIKELKSQRIAGPFQQIPLANFRTSPIGAVPKKDGTFRMITDLSSPTGTSINDYISNEESTVSFTGFDAAVDIVSKLGPGAKMGKLDIKSAFRNCPVRREDWHLLGFSFCNLFFVDLCLPFGLRSSVNRFTRLSDTLTWILKSNYGVSNLVHYLDDFFLAANTSADCESDMNLTCEVFQKLGVPLAPEKIFGPVSSLTYLGIVIDSQKMEIRLPADKFEELLSSLRQWQCVKKCTKRDLLSLIGKLSFASKVIPAGRTFLRRLIDLSTTVTKLHHRISLNKEARLDIEWWIEFLPSWNGCYKIPDFLVTPAPSIDLYTDASGELGFGIFFDGKWLSVPWHQAFQSRSIQWKELFPIYVSLLIWGPSLCGKKIVFHCDNLAVVNIWSSKTSKCKEIMRLMRRMFYLSAQHQFSVNVAHIVGTDNSIADSLSRFQMERFFQLVPGADRVATPLPPHAWNI